ncbi:MAG: NAD(P)-dependent oxidoreductase [Candidatus Pacebacteria bacterium]|nr:NAD(P)-dependent oxidoreductase [Candidatus Paceibacterota bacterium]
MKIILFEVPKSEQAIFLELLAGIDITLSEEKLSESNIAEAKDADIVCIFTNSMITKNVIDFLPNLKAIVTRSTGFDHIDVAYAHTKNIKICNVPAYGSETVAEFTFALILTLSRKVREATLGLKENGDYTVPANSKGFDLSGKTLGVIGTGKIGKNVIHIARGFGMNVVAYDMYPDLAFAKENNFTYGNLPDILAQADIVTLHAPYTKENHHLINKENISLFKKGAYLINTARGELVDSEALISSLKNGTIAGAGLDVLEGERLIKKGDTIPMLDMPNVVMTPHIAFNTKEAELRIMQTSVDNIKNFISGAPINLVK